MTHKYIIAGMHCQACIEKITNALGSVNGVAFVKVTLDPPEATVSMDHHVATRLLQEKVSSVGDYKLREVEETSREQIDNGLPNGSAERASLFPLYLIVAYITGVVVLLRVVRPESSWMDSMRHFMAGFFLVFSFFKLLDINGFVSTFRGYDFLARKSKTWAQTYPFVELMLGVLYLLNLIPTITNLVTLFVMSVGAISVLKVLLNKQQIRCACLGTALNLPMTTVTLVENSLMVVMATAMLTFVN